jgi:tRNA-specific 2-thiouridylase
MARVVLAMSGGVDSSVAAHLLKERGHEVIGLFMRTGDHGHNLERRTKTCCSATDALDARAVADRLDIPFYALDFENDFGRIIGNFVDEYAAGRTPNPCVLCNVWLKFGKLWSHGKQVGADFVATGHYARIVAGADGSPRIARAVDREKDQSYVLFGLRRDLLPHVLLPVGDFPKAEIRRLARELSLPVHDKADSQEICFIPDHDYQGFVKARRPGAETSGPIVDRHGRELGRHDGYEGFTIGQRKGLGIAAPEPLYVLEIAPETRAVTVGPRQALERGGLEASKFNWQESPPDGPIPCLAQIRARHQAVASIVEPLTDNRAVVRFEEPQPAVTPGQVVTIYRGDVVLGGGWIDRAID